MAGLPTIPTRRPAGGLVAGKARSERGKHRVVAGRPRRRQQPPKPRGGRDGDGDGDGASGTPPPSATGVSVKKRSSKKKSKKLGSPAAASKKLTSASATTPKPRTAYERIQHVVGGKLGPWVMIPRPNRAQAINTLLDRTISVVTTLTTTTTFNSEEASGDEGQQVFCCLAGMFRANQSRVGVKALLDGALCALALRLLGQQLEEGEEAEGLVAQSRALYGGALAALQAALYHTSEWRSSETLGAAAMLCFYELVAGTASPERWTTTHAAGVVRLIKRRGPVAHEASPAWDRQVLRAFRLLT